jgi:hypothetical protein
MRNFKNNANFKDMSGLTFGRLEVIERIENHASGNAQWLCACSCGSETRALGSQLRKGSKKSCGCINRTHGQSATPTHVSWSSMQTRCSNPNHPHYPKYGGRGIVVCKRWLDFRNFLSDMGERPHGTSLDRIDTNGDYSPENCRWATPRQQGNNRSDNKIIEHGGESKTVAQWSRKMHMKPDTLHRRLAKGWSAKRAIEQPVRKWSSS